MTPIEQAARELANEIWKDVPEEVLINGLNLITNEPWFPEVLGVITRHLTFLTKSLEDENRQLGKENKLLSACGKDEVYKVFKELEEENKRLLRAIELKERVIDNRPLCPDCRDKTKSTDECLRCKSQRLEGENKRLRKLES